MAIRYPLNGIRRLINRLSEGYIITKNVAIPYKGVDYVAPLPLEWNFNGYVIRNPNISLTRDKYGDIYDSCIHIYTTDNMPLDFWTAGLINTNYTLKKKEILEGDPLYRIAGFIEVGESIRYYHFIGKLSV